ncbi:hypothetical protein DFH08DRAFT_795639 [Mycena albidolilacea]|uniref:Uncharacterized protein n=1 Tax=Mycena albidolilacea TaxID=1033008 RepID=A0AAD7AT41_9AGAR|nr:hypothetical protein DFH08DRAFT_795639 [Mycena albidolilacea]
MNELERLLLRLPGVILNTFRDEARPGHLSLSPYWSSVTGLEIYEFFRTGHRSPSDVRILKTVAKIAVKRLKKSNLFPRRDATGSGSMVFARAANYDSGSKFFSHGSDSPSTIFTKKKIGHAPSDKYSSTFPHPAISAQVFTEAGSPYRSLGGASQQNYVAESTGYLLLSRSPGEGFREPRKSTMRVADIGLGEVKLCPCRSSKVDKGNPRVVVVGHKNGAGNFQPLPEVPSVLQLGYGIDLETVGRRNRHQKYTMQWPLWGPGAVIRRAFGVRVSMDFANNMLMYEW